MESIASPEFSRNYGFWNEAEQQAIMRGRVAIAGVGGDGFQLGLKLAMMGVCTFDIADPEVFEPENTNRVPGATKSTYGKNKAEVFLEKVQDINPDVDIKIYKDGLTADNVNEFLNRATLVYDESELTHLEIGTMLARAARSRHIPNVMVMNVGFAAQVTSFDPHGRYTFERFMGIPDGMPVDEVKDLSVDLSRCLPYLPSYVDLRSLFAVQEGAPLPSIAQGVDVASAIGASQGFLHMTSMVHNKRPQPVWAPRVAYIDAYNYKSGIARFPRASHYRHVAYAAIRHYLKLNPKASYTTAERNARGSR